MNIRSQSSAGILPTMTRPPALARTTLALLILSFGSNSAQTNKAAKPSRRSVDSSPKPQIESKLLRIEFDHNLHTRVIPLFPPRNR